MSVELKGYLFFLLMAGCAAVVILFAVYLAAIIEITSFVFSILALGVGSG